MATGKNEWDKVKPDEMTDQTALTTAVKRFGIRLYGEGCSSYPPIEGKDYHTWAVGRLIEAMGKAFRGVNITMSHKWCVYLELPRTTTYGVVVLSTSQIGLCDTPLQALIAARTAMLEEGNHAT